MQQSLEEILREKMAVPVSIKGKEGATVMPMSAINMAVHGCFGECVCHDSLCEPGEVRLGYIVNEMTWPFPTNIPSIRRYTDPRRFVCTAHWLQREAVLKAEKEQSQESVGADSNKVAPAPTLSDPVQVEKPKQPQQLSLW